MALAIVLTNSKRNIQNGHHLFCFQMVGLLGIQMAFQNLTIMHLNNFPSLEIWTSPVFGSPMYSEDQPYPSLIIPGPRKIQNS